MKYLFLSILCCLAISCKNKSNATAVDKKTEKQENPDESCALKIGFFSKGSGIDRDLLKQLDIYLADKKEKEELDYAIEQKGREGERTYCLSFSKIQKSKFEKIKEELTTLIGTSDLVRFL